MNTGRSVTPKAFNKLNATTKINEGLEKESRSWKHRRGSGMAGSPGLEVVKRGRVLEDEAREELQEELRAGNAVGTGDSKIK